MSRLLSDVFFLCLLCGLQSNIVLAEDQGHGRHVFANMQSSLWTKDVGEITSEYRKDLNPKTEDQISPTARTGRSEEECVT